MSWLSRLLYGTPLACGCCYEGSFRPLPPPCERMKQLIRDSYIRDGMEPPYNADGSNNLAHRRYQSACDPANGSDYTSTFVFDASCPHVPDTAADAGCGGGDGGGGE